MQLVAAALPEPESHRVSGSHGIEAGGVTDLLDVGPLGSVAVLGGVALAEQREHGGLGVLLL
jgi:hypothetical protein